MMNTTGRFKAIVFDLDGTLVDSIDSAYSTYAAFVTKHGGTPSREEFEKLNGVPFPRVIATLAAHLNSPSTLADLSTEYQQALQADYLTSVKLNPSVRSLLDWAKAEGLRLALVTSAPSTLVELVLNKVSVRDYFQVIITADHVKLGKPDPEPYQLAIRQLGLNADACLAIEDSAVGLTSASGAGLTCLAYQGTRKNSAFAVRSADYGASRLISDFAEVKEFISAYGLQLVTAKAFTLQKAVNGGATTSFADEQAPAIERFFAGALRQKPSLFDGEVVVARVELSEDDLNIIPAIVKYRELYARTRGFDLDFVALAVSAITEIRQTQSANERHTDTELCYYALGKRSAAVNQYPECWEFVPSGSVSGANLRLGDSGVLAQLREEYAEEFLTGCPIENCIINSIQSVGAILDRANAACDLFYKLSVSTSDLRALSELRWSNVEYSDVRLISAKSVTKFICDAGDQVVPTVEPIAKLMGIYP